MSTWNKRTSLKVLQHRLQWQHWRYLHTFLILRFYYTHYSLAPTVPSLICRIMIPSKPAGLNKFSTCYKLTTLWLCDPLKLTMCCLALQKLTHKKDFWYSEICFILLAATFHNLSKHFMLTLYGCNYCLITAMQCLTRWLWWNG